MEVYKKLFKYIPDYKGLAYLSMVVSGISSVLMVYGYYLIYLFLRELVIRSNYENASLFAFKIVFYLTISPSIPLFLKLVSKRNANFEIYIQRHNKVEH